MCFLDSESCGETKGVTVRLAVSTGCFCRGRLRPRGCSLAPALVPLGDVIGLCLHGDCSVKTPLENLINVFCVVIFHLRIY